MSKPQIGNSMGLGLIGFRVWGLGSVCHLYKTRGLQCPLIKEYTLNYNGVPTMIYGIFLNSGTLESPGAMASMLYTVHRPPCWSWSRIRGRSAVSSPESLHCIPEVCRSCFLHLYKKDAASIYAQIRIKN